MRVHTVHVEAVSSGGAEVIDERLTDGASWPLWSPIESVELEKVGDPPPEGVGAIRVLRLGRSTGRDQILELAPNQRFEYASLSGVPVRDYVGTVELVPLADGRTLIRWCASFEPRIFGSGALVERSIRRFLRRCVVGLAAYTSTNRDADAA